MQPGDATTNCCLDDSAFGGKMSSAPTPHKLPCFMLAYFDEECIRRSIQSLTPLLDRLALHVVENCSPNSDTSIAELRRACLDKHQCQSWVRYKQNISGNALLDVLTRNVASWRDVPYVILTDGDLECDPGWFDESMSIFKLSDEIAAVGVELSMENLPVATFPDARTWVPPAKPHPDGYSEGFTGGHLLVLRTDFLADFLEYRQRYALPMVDAVVHTFSIRRRKKWARTTKHKAWHITWSIYQDLDHPYTRHKCELMKKRDCWKHQRLSAATVFTRDGEVEWPVMSGLFAGGTVIHKCRTQLIRYGRAFCNAFGWEASRGA